MRQQRLLAMLTAACVLFVLHSVSVYADDTVSLDDSVIIEADSNANPVERWSRALAWQPEIPVFRNGGPCLTSRGEVGRCATFRECYPYFKIPDLSAFEGWILGVYDTCSYTDTDGRTGFGVCCVNPPPSTPDEIDEVPHDPVIADSEIEDSDLNKDKDISSNLKPQPQVPSNWPPPLPTHSPDNTIPPLPTHPPFVGFPINTPRPPALPPFATTTKPGAGTTWPTKPGGWWTQPSRPTTPRPLPTPGIPAPGPDDGAGIGNAAVCGAKNGNQDQERIVGGHSADLGEWPWVAALFNMNRQFCGGSLITDKAILTAAHCVAQMSSWDVARLTVRLGDHNIKTNSEVQHVERKVRRIVRHRGFDMRTLYNDVAILIMDQPVSFTDRIRPVCLPTGSQLYAGKTATVIGWGSLRESGPQPAVLQEVSIPIWTNTECKSKYGSAAPGGIIESFVCAGRAAQDSCSGDSGGPLMVNNGRWEQIGIVSWGIGCGKGQYPGVYTRVTHFLPWIKKNLK